MSESQEIIVPQLPYMEQIFRRLKTNAFINEETFSTQEKHWYNQIHENFGAYQAFFSQLGYRLESGPGYFHLSEPKPSANIVSTLRNNIGDYIRMLTVLTEYGSRATMSENDRSDLEPGAQFKVYDLLSFCDDNDEVKALLPSSNDGLLASRVSAYLRWVASEGFIAISPDESTVMVTSSFRYLKEFVLRIRLYGDYAKYNLPGGEAKQDSQEKAQSPASESFNLPLDEDEAGSDNENGNEEPMVPGDQIIND